MDAQAEDEHTNSLENTERENNDLVVADTVSPQGMTNPFAEFPVVSDNVFSNTGDVGESSLLHVSF